MLIVIMETLTYAFTITMLVRLQLAIITFKDANVWEHCFAVNIYLNVLIRANMNIIW